MQVYSEVHKTLHFALFNLCGLLVTFNEYFNIQLYVIGFVSQELHFISKNTLTLLMHTLTYRQKVIHDQVNFCEWSIASPVKCVRASTEVVGLLVGLNKVKWVRNCPQMSPATCSVVQTPQLAHMLS